MKRKLGINCGCIKDLPHLEALNLIKKVGFDCIFLDCDAYKNEIATPIKKRADELGLGVEFIHAPFIGCNSLWIENENTQPFLTSIFDSIDAASNNGIPAIIMHASSSWLAPPITDMGLQHFDRIIEYGKKKNVRIAFENMRTAPSYSLLLQRYKDEPAAAYCYDNGHEYCWNPNFNHIEAYKDKMCCCHLHDNLGKLDNYLTVNGDLHLLPFDGTFDYAQMIRRMDENGYTGALTLEVFNTQSPEYQKMTAQEFITTAYQRLKRISDLQK